jgi:hypothetical protein
MNRIAAYCYGISAVSVAAIIQNSAAPTFWEDRPITSVLMAASVPLNVAVAWLMEHRPIKAHSIFYKITCGFAMLIGIVGIGMFIYTISPVMGFGFLGGLGLAFWSINGFSDPFVDHYTKNNPERREPDDR